MINLSNFPVIIGENRLYKRKEIEIEKIVDKAYLGAFLECGELDFLVMLNHYRYLRDDSGADIFLLDNYTLSYHEVFNEDFLETFLKINKYEFIDITGDKILNRDNLIIPEMEG
jgi:hypothetical protein